MNKMKYYKYDQNNSGGTFDICIESGLGEYVIIEALSEEDANDTALDIGIYFDGVEDGIDCECCGDRWYSADECETLDEAIKYTTSWSGNPSFIHYNDGHIVEIKEDKGNIT